MRLAPPALHSTSYASGWATTRSAGIGGTWDQARYEVPASQLGFPQGRMAQRAREDRAVEGPAVDPLGARPARARRALVDASRGRPGGADRGDAARLAVVRPGAGRAFG